jgi:uncharacterized membrane protein (DUF485 family)
VTFVRHDLEILIAPEHQVAWDSLEQFLVFWFVHTVAVFLVVAITFLPVIWFQKFFLGYEWEDQVGDRALEVTFNILMTVLVTAVGILFVAHSGATDYSYDDF